MKDLVPAETRPGSRGSQRNVHQIPRLYTCVRQFQKVLEELTCKHYFDPFRMGQFRHG